MTQTRRTFLKGAVGASALSLMPTLRARGANEDIRIGVLGVGSQVKLGGKGLHDAIGFSKIPGVRIAALCDCDSAHLARGVAHFEKQGQKVKAYRDFRKLLDDREIDAVTIATPNHWHALMTILACRAGKDVYVQKPSTHYLYEGRKMIEAAKRYHRIVQCTHAWRSSGAYAEAIAYARSGQLGKMTCIRGINYKPRMSIGKVTGNQPIPASCDYDLWCGPAPKKPLRRKNLHYDWHWDWTTGDGDLGNMGIHFMDACRWAGGYTQLPKRVVSVGGRFGYDDDGQTPNTLISLFDYPVPIVFEVRGLPKHAKLRAGNWGRNPSQTMDRYRDERVGTVIECEGGEIKNQAAYDKDGKLIKKFTRQRVSCKQNFIDCMRSRKVEDLYSGPVEGHLSCGLVHMANISYRIQKKQKDDVAETMIRKAPAMTTAYDRMFEHLEANEIDLKKTPLKFGSALKYNPAANLFTNEDDDDPANLLAVPIYRKPYVMPSMD